MSCDEDLIRIEVITYALHVTPGNGPPSTAILFANIESLSQKERMEMNGGDGEPL